MNDQFFARETSHDLSLKLWRGERMCLIGMDVNDPADDFVGFAIEVKAPGAAAFVPLNNRLAFSYPQSVKQAVTGARWYSSLEAPFQKFRWIDFPNDPKEGGDYQYRVTEMHMPRDGQLVKGTSVSAAITLDPIVYQDFLDVGFTRNFASSQAYADRYKNNPDIIPKNADAGLKFKKVPGDVYEWLGFEAYQLIFGILDEVLADRNLSLDVFAYDLNEPDFVNKLEKLGNRLRIVIDNSGTHKPSTSAESQAERRLAASAGRANVKRMNFIRLQHNKVLIVKSGERPQKVLFGSTNFSFRGIYIQANNALVVYAPQAAQLFEEYFQLAFENAATKPKKWFKAERCRRNGCRLRFPASRH
jgi:PLD-like domain